MKRHAYGYKRSERDFAHIGPVDRIWLDGEKTERQERMELLREVNLRAGDRLILIAKGDLGAVGERKRLEQIVADRGAVLEVIEPPTPLRRRGPRARLSDLNDGQRAACARLWHDLTVPGPYAHKRIQEIAGWDVTRNQLNHHFGPREKPRNRN